MATDRAELDIGKEGAGQNFTYCDKTQPSEHMHMHKGMHAELDGRLS